MKIYKALKNSMLGQGFDCNPWMKEFYANVGMTNHGGYDWGATTGQVVWYDCDVPGFVLNTETDCYGGLGINIITENEDGVFKHRFWHLKDFLVKAGDKVEMDAKKLYLLKSAFGRFYSTIEQVGGDKENIAQKLLRVLGGIPVREIDLETQRYWDSYNKAKEEKAKRSYEKSRIIE